MKMRKKRRRYGSRAVWLGAMMVVLIALYFAIVLLLDKADTFTHSETFPPDPVFIHDGEPVIETVVRLHKNEDFDHDAINRQLPAPLEVLVLDEDITANSAPNYVILAGDPQLPDLSRAMRDVGYTHTFFSLIVYEIRNRTLQPVLSIDREAIRDEFGRQLIDQVPARYGYALLMETYVNEALYDGPVQLIEMVMLNEQGHEASDDIIIYWDTSESVFKATNTFGAP